MDSVKAILLDRDGTIIEDRNYITSPDMVALLPGAAEAIAGFRKHGWKVFVVSNQSAVAQGKIDEDELAQINLRMVAMLGSEGAALNGIYCCPHHPEGSVRTYAIECDCRKPKPGLLEQAAREHGLDLTRCVVIGDSQRDLDAGRAVGAATVLVLTGNGRETAAGKPRADHVAKDLLGAAVWLRAKV